MDEINWLHLSDFHLNSKQNLPYNENDILTSLVSDIKELRRTYLNKLDFIFIT